MLGDVSHGWLLHQCAVSEDEEELLRERPLRPFCLFVVSPKQWLKKAVCTGCIGDEHATRTAEQWCESALP